MCCLWQVCILRLLRYQQYCLGGRIIYFACGAVSELGMLENRMYLSKYIIDAFDESVPFNVEHLYLKHVFAASVGCERYRGGGGGR